MVTFDPTKSQLLSFRYKKWEYLQIRSCPSITILDEILRTKWRWKHGLNYSPPVWEFFSVFVISAVNPTKWNGFELSEMLMTIFWSRDFGIGRSLGPSFFHLFRFSSEGNLPDFVNRPFGDLHIFHMDFSDRILVWYCTILDIERAYVLQDVSTLVVNFVEMFVRYIFRIKDS